MLFRSCCPFLKNSKCLSTTHGWDWGTQAWFLRALQSISKSSISFQAHIWNLSFENSLLLIWIQAEHNFPDDSQTVWNINFINASQNAHARGHGHCIRSHRSPLNPVWLRDASRPAFSIYFKPPHNGLFLLPNPLASVSWLSLFVLSLRAFNNQQIFIEHLLWTRYYVNY